MAIILNTWTRYLDLLLRRDSTQWLY